MKFLIASSPKTGNVWLENLLAHIYDLPIVDMSGTDLLEIPPSKLSSDHFVAHQHYMPTNEILRWGEEENVQFFTTIRHPGDMFVSMYYYVNNFAPFWRRKGQIGTSGTHIMIDKAINSPEVLSYLSTAFVNENMIVSLAWMKVGKSIVVRYEDLVNNPIETMKILTDRLRPVPLERLVEAEEACRIEKIRERSIHLKLHCRDGSVNQWKHELGPDHISIFREYAHELKILGYDFDEFFE
jgi:hypothetical protein